MQTVNSFESVVRELESAAYHVLKGHAQTAKVTANVSYSSFYGAFRSGVDVDKRKAAGAFFTDERLSSFLIKDVKPTASVCDPACGAGDLLLTHARQLPVRQTFDGTLDLWGERLIGRELDVTLARAMRARMVLLAAHRFTRMNSGRVIKTLRSLDSLFPHLLAGDGLEDTAALSRATHIWLNPPYTKMIAASECTWATGSVSTAAVFVEQCLKYAKPGTQIAAILPDVLRAGSRYRNWRTWIELVAEIDSVQIVGKFDADTGVDVFILRMTVRADTLDVSQTATAGAWVKLSKGVTLGDLFRISVGPLVDYRSPKAGPWRPYLDVSEAPPWTAVSHISQSRRFSGKAVESPFLVIRRTSSPHDKRRAVASLVLDPRMVAVENHLLILEPRDGLLKTCKQAMEILSKVSTTSWLNERIRCRHLTVGSVEQIPWSE